MGQEILNRGSAERHSVHERAEGGQVDLGATMLCRLKGECNGEKRSGDNRN